MGDVKKIHHVAVVVGDIDGALNFWHDALGLELAEVRDVPAEEVKVAFMPAGDSEVELVQPTTDESGIAKYLAKRGEGMHHLCVEVGDLEGVMARLAAKGIRLINEEPRTNAEGRRYAFVHPKSTGGVLVELYESV